MADAPRPILRCDTCGQSDDHPKHHYGRQTFHHDCTPASVIDEMTSLVTLNLDQQGNVLGIAYLTPLDPEDYHPGVKRFLEIREAAMKGTRGPKLLAHITKMHEGAGPEDLVN
jgi:hypothetical protein